MCPQSGGPRVEDLCCKSFGVSLLRFLIVFTVATLIPAQQAAVSVALWIGTGEHLLCATSSHRFITLLIIFLYLSLLRITLLFSYTRLHFVVSSNRRVLRLTRRRLWNGDKTAGLRALWFCAFVSLSVYARVYKDQVNCREHHYHSTLFLVYNSRIAVPFDAI